MAIQLESGKDGRRIRPSMNVTPLVDVVLVLLIIFMIMTQNMARVMSLHVPAPNKASQPGRSRNVHRALESRFFASVIGVARPPTHADQAARLR